MKNPMPPTPRFVKEALSKDTLGDFSNRVLYKLCKDHPDHKRDEVIIAKVMLIGRAYAAAIERGAGAGGDDFYKKKVAPKIRQPGIDSWFSKLRKNRNDKSSETENMVINIETHAKVMKLFKKISRKDKRSLASKYLHFHFPKRFYIFDSRAQKAISKHQEPIGRSRVRLRGYDHAYARFYLRCEALNNRMSRRLSPRELDKVLLARG